MQMQQAQSLPQAQQNPQAQGMAAQAQAQMQQGMAIIQKLQHTATLDQVLRLLKDQRTKAFVLDIETDSTIVADEQAEKQGRTEFIGVLSQMLPQLAQMITAEPQTATFCGELLKFAVAPFRAGRSMDGAINDLVEQMKQKGDQPQGDDPTTAQNKTAIQIEQMKLQAQRESDAAKLKVQQDEMAQKDNHFQQDLQNRKDIKAMELSAKGGDDQAKIAVQNQKLLESRESHQANMMESQQDMQLNQQKADLAIQTHNMKLQQAEQRAAQQHAAQQFKMQQPPGAP
jgi:hypothetical protein